MCVKLYVLLLCCVLAITVAHELPRMSPAALYTTLPDSYVLSELPLSALLKVKKSVKNIICSGYFPKNRFDSCPAISNPNSYNDTKSSDFTVENSNDDVASSRTLSGIRDLFSGSDDSHPVSSELQDRRKTYYEHGHGGGMWKGSEESGKIQKLFQFSITALAFLAFGGYLLCMIVQAIKSKGIDRPMCK